MDKNFELIKQFFENLKCSHCDNFFARESVQPVRKEENNVVVRITCLNCGKNLGLAILGLDKNEYKNSLQFHEEDYEYNDEDEHEDEFLQENGIPYDPITYDDVIEAHHFFNALGSDWQKYLPKEEE